MSNLKQLQKTSLIRGAQMLCIRGARYNRYTDMLRYVSEKIRKSVLLDRIGSVTSVRIFCVFP